MFKTIPRTLRLRDKEIPLEELVEYYAVHGPIERYPDYSNVLTKEQVPELEKFTSAGWTFLLKDPNCFSTPFDKDIEFQQAKVFKMDGTVKLFPNLVSAQFSEHLTVNYITENLNKRFGISVVRSLTYATNLFVLRLGSVNELTDSIQEAKDLVETKMALWVEPHWIEIIGPR